MAGILSAVQFVLLLVFGGTDKEPPREPVPTQVESTADEAQSAFDAGVDPNGWHYGQEEDEAQKAFNNGVDASHWRGSHQ